MSLLSDDLEKFKNEAVTKKDIKAGFKLIAEIGGIITVAGVAFTAVTVWLPGVGIPVSGYVAFKIVQHSIKSYSSLDGKERKSVRAVVRFLTGKFDGVKDLLG